MLLCIAKAVYLKQTTLNQYYCTEVSSYLFYSLSIAFTCAKCSGKASKLVLIFINGTCPPFIRKIHYTQ